MILILAALISVSVGVEHATDIEIHKVEVYEIPWQEGPSTPEAGPPPHEYGPPQQEFTPPEQGYGPPQQEHVLPGQGYDLPKPVYGPPPKPVYGPPPAEEPMTTTELADTTATTEFAAGSTTEMSTTSESSANETVTESAQFQYRNERRDKLGEQRVYYVYHPEGLLQKVSYPTVDDTKKMEYPAELK